MSAPKIAPRGASLPQGIKGTPPSSHSSPPNQGWWKTISVTVLGPGPFHLAVSQGYVSYEVSEVIWAPPGHRVKLSRQLQPPGTPGECW